jgi:hypothetical protein
MTKEKTKQKNKAPSVQSHGISKSLNGDDGEPADKSAALKDRGFSKTGRV